MRCRCSSVSIVARRGVGRPGFCKPPRPDLFYWPLTFLSSRIRGLFPRRWSGRCVNLTINIHLVSRSRIHGAIPQLAQCVFIIWWRIKYMGFFNFTIYQLKFSLHHLLT